MAQRMALTDYAAKNGYLIADYYADEGISARKPMKYRKELLRLLNDVRDGNIDMILVTKLDRWFRNIRDYNITEDILAKNNCHWKTIFENYDSSTANGQMVINIMLSVNQAECDRTSERIKAVFKYKIDKRLHVNGALSYGYKTDENGFIIKDDSTSHIVDEIVSRYFVTYSKREVRNYIESKNYDNPPTVYQVNRILGNEVYTGRKFGKDDYCPAYMTRKQFEMIKSITQTKTHFNNHNSVYYFSSLIVCPVCGNKFTGFTKKQELKSGGYSYYKRYRCENKWSRHGTACITESVIEKYLIDNIMLNIDNEINSLKEKKAKVKVDKSHILKAEIERLNIQFQKGRISEQYYDEQYEILSDKLELYKGNDIDLKPLMALKSQFNDGWLKMYRDLNDERKKAFWKGALREITIDAHSRKVNGFTFLV
ncbi:MAG: recombinase family protein [Lachnospiraceae bacterium]|nr:recombinase family protein [Lachnospiraceae bacterium]